MVAVALSNITAVGVRLELSGYTAGTTSIEVQLGSRHDWKWCVAPIFGVAGTPATYDISGLNQRATIYGRVREVSLAGPGSWATFAFRTSDGAAQDLAPAPIMIEPAIIATIEPVLSWAASNQVAGFPVSNLGRDAPVGWKAVGAGPTLTIEMGGSPWDLVALLNSNLPEGATVTIRGGATAAAAAAAAPLLGPTPFRASANLPGRDGYHGWFRLAAPVTHRFAHITFGGAMPPANTLYLEHALIGLARQSRNHAVDKKEAGMDLGTLDRSRSGNPSRQRGLKMRTVDFEIALATETQFETLYGDLFRRVGETEPVLVLPNSKPGPFLHDRILYGNFTGGSAVNPIAPYYSRTFTLASLI